MKGKEPLSNELKERCLDFAKRMCFTGWPDITDARRKKLWSDAEWFLTDCLNEGATDWEDDEIYPCDWFSERFAEEYVPNTPKWDKRFENGECPKYYNTLCCICRAAFDVVSDLPGMVWALTVGDIRRMYDGELPEWFIGEGWQLMDDGAVDITKLPDTADLAI